MSSAVPCRAVPCRAVPCRAVPCRAVQQQYSSRQSRVLKPFIKGTQAAHPGYSRRSSRVLKRSSRVLKRSSRVLKPQVCSTLITSAGRLVCLAAACRLLSPPVRTSRPCQPLLRVLNFGQCWRVYWRVCKPEGYAEYSCLGQRCSAPLHESAGGNGLARHRRDVVARLRFHLRSKAC
jgi:hypothetical protein